MINALFSSQDGGTKCFTNENGTHFGWKVILDMYSRECSRRVNGNARMVSRVREAYVLRDLQTKLNVMPAKIMQVSMKLNYLFVILISNLSKRMFCQSYTIILSKALHQLMLRVSRLHYITWKPVTSCLKGGSLTIRKFVM